MDTSEKYIKMCEKAHEIQNLKTDFENGDVFYLIFDIVRDTFKVKKHRDYTDFKIGDISEEDSRAKCISFNEETQILEFEYFYKIKEDQIFVFSDNRNEYLRENCLCSDYLSDGLEYEHEVKKIWLPRQDQLQKIIQDNIYSIPMIDSLLTRFHELVTLYHSKLGFKGHRYSFEQLWLSFFMKEKHNKHWNEFTENWETIDLDTYLR